MLKTRSNTQMHPYNVRMIARRLGPALVVLVALAPFLVLAQAWSGPPGAPPSNNVSAPVNVGATSQTKNGVLGVNGLAVFGNSLLNGTDRYLNWGTTAGTSGYGIRDNAGVLEFKNSGGAWAAIGAGGSLPWLVSGNNIYNTNTANVGIGTPGPGSKLHVSTSGVTGNVAHFVSTGATDNPTFTFGNGSGSLRLFAGGGSGSYMTGVTQGDVGILFDSGDDFHIGQQSATPDITILDNGNVGFKTTAPTQDLHISDTAGGAFIDLEAGPASQSGIMFRGDREYRFVMRGNSDDFFTLRDQTAGADRIAVSTTGLVGIGTITPSQLLHVNGTVLAASFLYSSDKRLKHDIEVLEGGLDTLLALKPVSFTWNDGTLQEGKDDIGFIAQDVEEIVPEAVNTDANGMKSVDYARLMPVLVKAIQEQQQEIDALKAEVTRLQER